MIFVVFMPRKSKVMRKGIILCKSNIHKNTSVESLVNAVKAFAMCFPMDLASVGVPSLMSHLYDTAICQGKSELVVVVMATLAFPVPPILLENQP
jgi:hypothetical protein